MEEEIVITLCFAIPIIILMIVLGYFCCYRDWIQPKTSRDTKNEAHDVRIHGLFSLYYLGCWMSWWWWQWRSLLGIYANWECTRGTRYQYISKFQSVLDIDYYTLSFYINHLYPRAAVNMRRISCSVEQKDMSKQLDYLAKSCKRSTAMRYYVCFAMQVWDFLGHSS